MNEPQISLSFLNDRRTYFPGDNLACEYRLLDGDPTDIKALELSVLWYTEGKGDEDLAVHFFERIESASSSMDFRQPQTFQTDLPVSPLSYAGVIVKICWCARVRVFLKHGKELLAEESFQLGNIPAAYEAVA
jgi:hypothetical protein